VADAAGTLGDAGAATTYGRFADQTYAIDYGVAPPADYQASARTSPRWACAKARWTFTSR
jgi:hypothetical protein